MTAPERPGAADPAEALAVLRAAIREAIVQALYCQPDNFRPGDDDEYADEGTEKVMSVACALLAGATAQPVPIPLPSEPPRDRVLVARREDGSEVCRWAWHEDTWMWRTRSPYPVDSVGWSDLVRDCMDRFLRLSHEPAAAREGK